MANRIDKIPMPRSHDRRVKITDDQRRQMKRLYNAGWTQQEIADQFGVSKSAVCYVVSPKAAVNLRYYRQEHPRKPRTPEESRIYMRELREYKSNITFCVNQNCPFEDCRYHPIGIRQAKDDGLEKVNMVAMDATCRRYIGYLADETSKLDANMSYDRDFKRLIKPKSNQLNTKE